MFSLQLPRSIEARYHIWTLVYNSVQILFCFAVLLQRGRGGGTALVAAALAAGALGLGSLATWVHAGEHCTQKNRCFKPADFITLIRCILALLIPAVMLSGAASKAYIVFAIGAGATILDGFDGMLARRYGPTKFGGILDIECDTVMVQMAVISAIVLLDAPGVLILFTLWRYLYILSLTGVRNPGPLPRFWVYPMKVIGVLSVTALGSWYLLFIPRNIVRWYINGIVVLNTASFIVTWYYNFKTKAVPGK